MNPKISAIICTHNRAACLREAVRSLTRQSLSKDLYEIIVVDNASTDETRNVVCKEFGDIRNMRYLYEPQLGLSRARDTGWRSSNGPYVAYLDDDAVACSDWLLRLVEVFENVQPRPGIAGGPVELVLECDSPKWLTGDLRSFLAQVDWGSEARWLQENELLVGCNIAFDKDALRQINGFAGNLGRRGANLLSCEETLVVRKLTGLGRQSYYQPAASVKHHVPSARLNTKWFLRRYFWQGVSDALMDAELTRPSYGQGILRGLRLARKWKLRLRSLLQVARTYSKTEHLERNGKILHMTGNLIGYFKRGFGWKKASDKLTSAGYVYQPGNVLPDPVRALEELRLRIPNEIKPGRVPHEEPAVVAAVQEQCKAVGVSCREFRHTPGDLEEFQKQAKYASLYPNYYRGNLPEKSYEHFVVSRLLSLEKGRRFVDLASESSPLPDIFSRLYGVESYSQDIMYPEGVHGRKIGGSATRMPVPDSFFDSAALTCSLEHFEGCADTELFRELARVLRPGGRVCVVPLYLHTQAAIQTDPRYSAAVDIPFDPEAVLYAADGWANRHARFYSAATLSRRLIEPCREMLDFEVHRLVNAPEIPGIYARWALVATKR